MENKHIIAILIIIIIILVVALAAVALPSLNSKEATKLTITSNNTLYEGENLSVNLTTINGTPIVGEKVNVTVINEDGSKDFMNAVTDENGTAQVKLDKREGNYTVNCTYGGNENYSGNSTQQELNVIKEVVEQVSSQSSSSSAASSSSSKSSQSDYRPAVDSGGITREEADYWGWQYTPEHGGHYHGSRDAWDEKAGVYHD